MGNENKNKPDFVVDSAGGVSHEKKNEILSFLSILSLPDLFNAAGMKGGRNTEEFSKSLASLIAEKAKETKTTLWETSQISFNSEIRNKFEKAILKEGVSWEVFKNAWSSACNISHGREP